MTENGRNCSFQNHRERGKRVHRASRAAAALVRSGRYHWNGRLSLHFKAICRPHTHSRAGHSHCHPLGTSRSFGFGFGRVSGEVWVQYRSDLQGPASRSQSLPARGLTEETLAASANEDSPLSLVHHPDSDLGPPGQASCVMNKAHRAGGGGGRAKFRMAKFGAEKFYCLRQCTSKRG